MRVFLCNIPAENAEHVARTLVEERLAACVNLLPGVVSFYVWKGELQRDTETTMLIKTSDGRRDELMARIRELHPYEVPEIVGLTASEVSQSYDEWVIANTTA